MKHLRLLSFFLLAMFMATSLASAVAPARPPEPTVPAQEKLPPPPPAEVLAKITAPVANPVIKTKQGYSVAVDRTKQVLSVRTPKKDIWISPNVEARQTVEVITDGAPLQQDARVLAKLKKGRILYAVEEKGEWMLTPIVEDGEIVRGWVQKKNLKPVAEDCPPQKSLAPGERFASAAMLIQKGKQFDDGLYAAVELAMQNGIGPVEGKKEWLPRLACKIEAAQGGTPLAQLFDAAQFGGMKAGIPSNLARAMDEELKAFLADEKRSKPLGFYSWSKELENIFRQDRMLQTANDAAKNKTALVAIAQALAADVEARKSYEQSMRLNERLTNKLMSTGYRPLLAQIDAGQSPQPSAAQLSFFPASRSHEADLVMKLYGNKPIPPGFELMTEVIKRLKSGELSFEPTAESGWYDHQLWSLEPLVRYDALPEAKKAQPNDEYRKHLEELFKETYALMRETHVKQLALPAPGAAPDGDRPPVKEREKVFIQPEPHAELLPTMYARRAQSYRFVRQVLDETFGKDHVAKMHRLTANGPVEMNLAAELDLMERLFGGAYIVACRDLGLVEALPEGLGAGQPADDQAAIFLRWVASLASDPDLAPDARMMVPAFYDQQRKKTKVWAFLGWESASSTIDYVQHPGITITDADGKPVPANEGPEVIYYASYRSLATPVFAEVYVTKLLNRSEFRRHCDAYQTKAAILANLE